MKILATLAAGAVLFAAAAQADESFQRKPGEWQVTMIGQDGKPNPPRNFCFGPGSIQDITKSTDSCSKNDISRSGGTTIVDAVCTKGGQQITLHLKITAAGDSAYHSEMHSTYSPGVGGMSSVDIITDAKWLGPCPAGEKPIH